MSYIQSMKKFFLLGLMLALSGCGQKGPLYLPDDATTNEQQDQNSTGSEQSEKLENQTEAQS